MEANFQAMFELDSDGLNPLMRAAKYGRVSLILGMLLRYPQSMECRDKEGKSFLHHLRLKINARDRDYTLFNCRRILGVPAVDILACSIDQDGNTPVHLAILNKDYDLAQVILEQHIKGKSSSRKELIINIKNSEGNIISDMITLEPDIPPILKNLLEQLQASRVEKMDDKVYKAAREFNVGVFKGQAQLLGRGLRRRGQERVHYDDDDKDEDEDEDYEKEDDEDEDYENEDDEDEDEDEDYENEDDEDEDEDYDNENEDEEEEDDDEDDDEVDNDEDGSESYKCYNFLAQDAKGKNILHIATESLHSTKFNTRIIENYQNFVREAIERFPQLLSQNDCNNDTPLHVAARLLCGNELLDAAIRYWWYDKRHNKSDEWLEVPPWKVKNSRSHTPLHEAARSSCVYGSQEKGLKFCLSITELDEAHSDVNENGETALHLIARYMKQPYRNESGKVAYQMGRFVSQSKSAAYMRDKDGLTPILRAAHGGHIWLVTEIGLKHPESINIRDRKGKNVWHYLCLYTTSFDGVNELEGLMNSWEDLNFSFVNTLDVMLSEDDDGNTPLHLAIMDQNYEVVYYFIRFTVKVKSFPEMLELIRKKYNKDGKTIKNLITTGKDIPAKLKELRIEQVDPLLMDEYLYKAAKVGDINKIKKAGYNGRQLLCQAHDGRNIIHIALSSSEGNNIPFIKEVLTSSFELIYMKDSKGDTPLHLAAGLQTKVALELLQLCIEGWKTSKRFTQYNQQPWTVQNAKGNTFLHEAARLCKYKVISSEEVKGIDINGVNNNGETILHMVARYATNTVSARNFLDNMSEEMQSFVYIQDFEGFTPLLRAVQYGRLVVAKNLFKRCPHSIGIPDKMGRTVLHHLRAMVVDLVDEVNDVIPVWNNFYDNLNLDDLRIAQDKQGNTALHSAIIDGDFTKVKFLMEKCLKSRNKRELDIINNKGHTVFDLVSLPAQIPTMVQSDTSSSSYYNNLKELQPLVNRSYVKEIQLLDKFMDDTLYKAAIDGDIGMFESTTINISANSHNGSRPTTSANVEFCSQTPGGSTIVHIALRHGKENTKEFIETALKKYPILSIRPDCNGDTPLHLAAKSKTGVTIVKLLIKTATEFIQDPQNDYHVPPWTVKNYKGSFPIHEALQTGNLEAAEELLGCDIEAVSRVNDLGETPLHSFAKNGFSISYEEAHKFVKKLVETNKQAAYKRDNEGHTPLLSAARSGRIQVVRAILEHDPQSAYIRDPKGRTFLHLLQFTGQDVDQSFASSFKKTAKGLFKIAEADALRLMQDYDGNTPLHYAIKNDNAIAAIVFTQRCLKTEDQAELGLLNKEGKTIPDLLALHDVPNEVIELMETKVPKGVYSGRSSYGIRKSDMKESANALSVVAALLATITFAAAFQVPGGFGDDGFPILLSKIAFLIFSVANTTAMCSSMLCLFLLLWVMGIGKIHGSLKVLDISIILLRISFRLTLLTFTTGVFVVTAEKNLWMGILVCVLGFLTFLLTFKFSIKTVAKIGGRAHSCIKKIPTLLSKSIM